MELCKEFKPVCLNEGRERLTENYEIDFQENLPQYLDDIDKIIRCSVNNCVVNYDITDSKLNIHGKSMICITYLNKDGCTLSNIFEEEFTKSIDVENGDGISFAVIRLNQKYSNFRLINQRRIDVHVSLCFYITLYRKDEKNCLSSCENAFTKNANIPCLVNKNAGIFTADFDETFSVSGGNSQIRNIVNTYSTCVLDETKIIKEKMLVKLKIEVSVLYLSDENNMEKCSHSFTLSKIVDVSDSDENDVALVCADVCDLYVKTKTDSHDLVNEIELVGSVAVNYRICTTDEQTFITDSYMPLYDTQVKKEKITVKQSPKYYYDDRSDEIIFDSEKNIIEIIDLKPGIENCSVENSVLKIPVCLSFLYYDDNSRLCNYEKTSEITFKLCDEEYDGEAAVNMISYDFVIKGADKISLRINYTYRAYLYRKKTVEYLTDIDVSGEKDNMNMPELTLYFADKSESIWDIAKKFSTDMNLIMEENNLSSDIIENKMVLLVPGM